MGRIAFQGDLGAYSHQACLEAFPAMEPVPCHTFEGAIAAVRERRAELAMLPVENSTYGRVADIHSLLPGSGLYIIGEHFLRIRICLLAVPGTQLEEVQEAMSHTVLLGQCRGFLERHGIGRVTGPDTAGSARIVAERGDPKVGALAAALAGEIYGLEVLARDIEDHQHNTTRFLVMSPRKIEAAPDEADVITSFVFEVRNIPAALYKALGGFATNGVNMTKLESYMVAGRFTATQFYAEITGHPESAPVRRAMDELRYFTSNYTLLGVFPAAPYRRELDSL
ncbi:MAG TPA: prephenate dehydratase [Paracoccaceae bacterium]|nr:prephenate dehydratase [Paracoccaceae bacterium]